MTVREGTVTRRNLFSGGAPRIRHQLRTTVVPSSTIADIVLRTMEGVLAAPSYSSVQELAERLERVNGSGPNKRFRLSTGGPNSDTNNGIILTSGLRSQNIGPESRISGDRAFFRCSFGPLWKPPEGWPGVSHPGFRPRPAPTMRTD